LQIPRDVRGQPGQRASSGNDPFTHELRFLLAREEASRFLESLAGRAHLTTYDAEYPVSYTQTTYFDTADAAYLSQLAGEPARRLRVRQYATAATLDAAPVFSGVGFIELKQHLGTARSKFRLAATATEIASLVRDPEGAIEAALVAGLYDEPVCIVARELALPTMAPRLSTWYRRVCLTVPGEALRITLDEGLQFCRPQPIGRPGFEAAPDRRDVLAAFPARILEVKHGGALPDWLAGMVSGLRATPPDFSKFRIGMQSLSSRRPEPAGSPAAVPALLAGAPASPTIVAA
jgi:hypothetical protein